MAKTDGTSGTTNRKQSTVAQNVSGVTNPNPVIAVDIALNNASFTRSSVQTDLDTAEATAIALSLSTGKPTRVTLDGAVYQLYTRNGG